jgi:hypothetical protein
MMASDLSRLKYVVEHSNLLSPEDYLRFIHLDGFSDDWKDLKLDDIDLQILQILIMLDPAANPVVGGTGGIRKMRFRPQSRNRGKSGSIRVLYASFPKYSVAVLAAAYGKSAKADITPAEKKTLKRVLKEIEMALEQNP